MDRRANEVRGRPRGANRLPERGIRARAHPEVGYSTANGWIEAGAARSSSAQLV